MRETELRIGNLVLAKVGVGKVLEVSNAGHIITDNAGFCDLDKGCVHPVELTEEWLINLGFNKTECLETFDGRLDKQVGFRYRNDLGERDYFYVISSEVDECSCYYYVTKEVKYVHQLQNIYHALTGDELCVK